MVKTYLIANDALRWLCSLCNRVSILRRQSVENGAASATETGGVCLFVLRIQLLGELHW